LPRMKTLTISLPAEMANWVRAKSARGAYGNISDLMREMIRERMRSEIEADVRTLSESMSRACEGPTEEQLARVLAIQKEVRRERATAGCP
jgi:Arc/MetJ-type ribon-helix-helix transcriptional regulator